MRLSNAHTREMVTDWALPEAYLTDGLDEVLHYGWSRCLCLPAPRSYAACLALRDDEMQKYFSQYGLAKYYPDISHERRAWLLWMQDRLWHWLGTPQAVETLVQYLFDAVDISLEVDDSLAFDENGVLVDSDLLDVFDAVVTISKAVLPPDMHRRLLANINHFKRDSQQLRAFVYNFEAIDETVNASCQDGGMYAVDFAMDIEADFIIPMGFNTNASDSSQSIAVDYEMSI